MYDGPVEWFLQFEAVEQIKQRFLNFSASVSVLFAPCLDDYTTMLRRFEYCERVT
jgi:hypothetical protein